MRTAVKEQQANNNIIKQMTACQGSGASATTTTITITKQQ
jgi:hypothetical protein